MDQLRKTLVWLKEQHFWVLSVLVALIGIGCWWKAAGTLSKAYDDNQKVITAGFNSLTNLSNDPFHPNETTNEKQLAEIKKQSDDVAAIWQQLYDSQRESVLKWPDALSKQFRERVEKLEFGSDDIPPDLLEHYQNYVWRHFPNLPKKIGARPLPEDQLGTLGGGRNAFRGEFNFQPDGEPDEGDYICEWVDQDQAAVREELEFGQRPSALRIWVTQENMWVYDTLLNAIKNTNDAAGATRISNAAVRTIYSLEVGQRAARYSRTKDRIYKVPTAAATAGAGEELVGGTTETSEQMAMPDPRSFAERGMDGRDGAPMTKEQESAMLLSYRYLGEDDKPFAPGGGGGAADPSAAMPIDPASIGTEYKRLPVRMVLQMDKRYLTRLIAECASQPLQVEVKEVRINTPDAGGGEGFRGNFAGGPGAGLFPDRNGLLEFPQQPHVGNVIIQGIIYIFKKPDPSVLQTEAPPLAGL